MLNSSFCFAVVRYQQDITAPAPFLTGDGDVARDWQALARPVALCCRNEGGLNVELPLCFDIYLLDTNVVSELRKPRPHGDVVTWIEGVTDSDLYLSAVTLGEIHAGIEITREQDAAKAAELETWADQVAAAFNVLPMDAATFRLWAKLMHRQPDTIFEDATIAACALVQKLTAVTRNVGDFERFQVLLINPFKK